jgi:hypothetical protein
MSAEARERLSRFVRQFNAHTESEWRVVERRIGSPGSPLRWQRFSSERDRRYGKGAWTVGYDWNEEFITEPDAVERFYNASYRMYLSRNAELVESLCSLASELTDSSAKLRGDPFLEVNAILAALDYLGAELSGGELLDLGIQSGLSDQLRATRVPFLGGLHGWSLEQFWFGESRCIGVMK